MPRTRRAYKLTILVLVLFCAYYAYEYYRDQVWLQQKAHEIAKGVIDKRDCVYVLRDYVRTHIQPNDMDLNNRPFLRDSAVRVLQTGTGYCGECVRSYICLARQLAIRCHRVNLHGKINHVVVEAEIEPNRWVLVDVQQNSVSNSYLDRREWIVEELIVDPQSPFNDYSTLSLNRIPLIKLFVRRVRLHYGFLTWCVENPSLIKSLFTGGLAVLLTFVYLLDRLLRKLYAWRLGVEILPTQPEKVS